MVGTYIYIFFKTICVVQLGSNLENPYVASLASLTPPWAAALMKEEMYFKISLSLTPNLWLGKAAGSCFPQHSPLTVLSRFGCLVPDNTGSSSPSPCNIHWELQLLLHWDFWAIFQGLPLMCILLEQPSECPWAFVSSCSSLPVWAADPLDRCDLCPGKRWLLLPNPVPPGHIFSSFLHLQRAWPHWNGMECPTPSCLP